MYYLQCKHLTDGVRCQEYIGYGQKIPVLMGTAELASAEKEDTAEEVKIVTLKCVSGHIHNYIIPTKS